MTAEKNKLGIIHEESMTLMFSQLTPETDDKTNVYK